MLWLHEDLKYIEIYINVESDELFNIQTEREKKIDEKSRFAATG